MKSKILTILLLALTSISFSQEKIDLKVIGLTLEKPKKWITIENKEILENLKKYDFTNDQKKELLKSVSQSSNIISFSKYNPKEYYGIIPTIKIRTHVTQVKKIGDLMSMVENSSEKMKSALNNFTFYKRPELTKISNIDAVVFTTRFTLNNDSNSYQIESKSFYILRDDYYISLNFIEEVGKEDNSEIFIKLLNSIEIKD